MMFDEAARLTDRSSGRSQTSREILPAAARRGRRLWAHLL